MLHVRKSIFGLLLVLLCPLHEGLATSVESEGNDVAKTIIKSGNECAKDADCTMRNTRCIDKTCQCTDGYVINGSLTACIEVATTYGDYCDESMQCSKRLLSGATCINNACACIDGYYYLNGRCNAYSGLFSKCDKNVDCYVHADYGAAYCNGGKCSCSPGYYQREYRTCRPEGKKVGDSCVINNDCKFSATAYCEDGQCMETQTENSTESFSELGVLQERNAIETKPDLGNCKTNADCINNAECTPLGKCVCKRAHFYKTGTCVPELGEHCDGSDAPAIKYSECKNEVWNCEAGKIASLDNRICRKATKQYEHSCVHNEQCSLFGPDSVCDGSICVCNENSHFVESEMFCWMNIGLNETCQQDHDCHIDGMEGELSCKNGVCLEDYVGIGSNCTSDGDCQPENSECKENHCTCKEDYVSTSFKSCAPVASFGEPCEADIQCSTNVPNAVCLSKNETDVEKTCRCSEDQHYKFDRCNAKRVLGESCKNLGECYLSSNEHRVRCKKDRCACGDDYVRANDTVCATQQESRYNNNGNTVASISGGFLSIAMSILLPISYHSLTRDY
ncbi:uncharacterized protein LOC143362460 isoform X2 [Halictus rubicundus]|uniref:uncharacterized protein LOC143362460 isoform X2 n=1 Tax=Halictus rubicundus TaxID=77578 RepID=UPI004035F9C2